MLAQWTVRINRAAMNAVARQHATRLVTDITRKTLIAADITTPTRSGRLRAGNRMRVEQQPGRVVGEVHNNTRYAAAVHDGSKPHIIRPRRKKVLRFKVGARIVYARLVNHPGTKAQPWLYNALVRVARPAGFRITRR